MGQENTAFTVFCDDLTGSSVQSILLKARGCSPTLQVNWKCGDGTEKPGPSRVLVVNLNTRCLDAEGARTRVDSLAGRAGSDRRLAKRIDTTLRGHLLAETACLLEHRPGAVALVVPAYPASGRTTIGGYQLLNGSLLERTEVAKDPVWPISASYVPRYFEGLYPVARLPMETVRLGAGKIAGDLGRKAAENRIIVADAQSDSDIEAIAEAAASLAVTFIPVDPGPFTAAYVYHTLAPGKRKTALAVIGSTSGVTCEQLEYLGGKLNVSRFRFAPGRDTGEVVTDAAAFVARLQREKTDCLVLQPEGPVLQGREDEVVNRLAEVGLSVMQELGGDLCGLILSGGDTAMSFLDLLGADFLEPVAELAPLMMGGRIRGTASDGLKVVTKGGLVGGRDGLYKALQWLRQEESE
ncbi:MAG: four-carbon acid sugar kinase family protein [Thermovirgaceae bacterium]